MAVRNLLVAYNASPSADAALRAALLMHRKYDAHVTGLLAHYGSRIDVSMPQWMPESMKASLRELEAAEHERIATRFRESAAAVVPADMLHWIDERGRADATAAQYARMYDVTIVGQHDVMRGAEHLGLHPDRIALKSGRPVLVVPKVWDAHAIHEHAVLAWNGRRAAARALADAMQILETKQLVTVVTVESGDLGQPLHGIDVETALRRHGVNVEMVKLAPGRGSVGATIIEYCTERGAGLIVTGAYEHSMFREQLVGGVTATLVAEATLPVLMSH